MKQKDLTPVFSKALNVLHSKYDGDKRKKELKRSKEKHNNREVNVDEDEEVRGL